MAARLALSSRHPLAVALSREAAGAAPYDGVVEDPGQGVRVTVDGAEARLGSPAFCGRSEVPAQPDRSIIAFAYRGRTKLIAIAQKLRPDAVETVAALRDLGLDLHILSGDRDDLVASVARELGITVWRGGLKPAEKIGAIDTLKAEGRRVLMVGDGLNDAPSLAAADVSLAPISAVDLAQAQADVVFLGEQLMPVYRAIVIARRARAAMTENLWLAALYNLVAVPVAIAGLATPLIAALAMSGSSSLVTLNALRVSLYAKAQS
jgi:Cu2+-exporting ATPase